MQGEARSLGSFTFASGGMEGEHNVEFVLSSLAHHACSPLARFLHEEELCKVALTCQLLLGCDLPQSGLSSCLNLE